MKDIKSKGTILLTVYSRSNAEYLDECLKSIFQQTYLPNEVLLIQEGEITFETDLIIQKWKYNSL